jgi:hypothetical protein
MWRELGDELEVALTLYQLGWTEGRLSRLPWNFGGGQWLIRRHPPWSV